MLPDISLGLSNAWHGSEAPRGCWPNHHWGLPAGSVWILPSHQETASLSLWLLLSDLNTSLPAQCWHWPSPAAAPADQRDLELRLHAVQAQSCSTSPGWRQQWHRGSSHRWQGCLGAALGPLQELCSFLPPLSSWLIKKCLQINPIKQCKAIQPTCKMEGYPAHDKGELSSPTEGEASSVRNAIHPILAAQKTIAKSIAFSKEIELFFQSCFQLITSWFLLIFCLKKPFSIATWFCSKIKRSIDLFQSRMLWV